MKVIKLDSSHIDATRHLFDNATYMSSTVNIFFADPTKERSDFYHEAFHTKAQTTLVGTVPTFVMVEIRILFVLFLMK
jgi:hypothetical protein